MPRRFRIDSYNHNKKRVSRKATTFDEIEKSTFRNYISEIQSKYPEGSKIISPNNTNINGKALKGSPILEVPEINKTSSKRSAFEAIANRAGVTIEYRLE